MGDKSHRGSYFSGAPEFKMKSPGSGPPRGPDDPVGSDGHAFPQPYTSDPLVEEVRSERRGNKPAEARPRTGWHNEDIID